MTHKAGSEVLVNRKGKLVKSKFQCSDESQTSTLSKYEDVSTLRLQGVVRIRGKKSRE